MDGPRAAEKTEFQQVVDLSNLVFRQAQGFAPTMHLEYPLLFNESNLENLRVIVEDGRPVSLVGIHESEVSIYGCHVPVGMIGSVCTHPQYRGRGFASLALTDAFRKMKRDRVSLVLVSGLRTLYDRVGCAVVGREFRFGITPEEAAGLPNDGFELEPFRETALQEIVRIRQREPVRFLDTPVELLALLSRPDRDSLGEVHPREVYLVQWKSAPVAYLAARTPRDGGSGDSGIVEYGGSRTAVAAGVALLIRQRGLRRLNLWVPWQDSELLRLLALAGLPLPKVEGFGGTVKLLQPARLLRALRPYLRERLGEGAADKLNLVRSARRLALRMGDEELPLRSDMDLARLLFGTPEVINPGNEKYLAAAPEPNRGGELARALRAAFPLPALEYGLNFT